MTRFPNLSPDEAADTFLAVLFESGGVAWLLRLLDEKGRRKRDMEAVRWKTGSGEQFIALYGSLNDTRVQWKPDLAFYESLPMVDVPCSVRITLPRHAYRHRRRLRLDRRCNGTTSSIRKNNRKHACSRSVARNKDNRGRLSAAGYSMVKTGRLSQTRFTAAEANPNSMIRTNQTTEMRWLIHHPNHTNGSPRSINQTP